MPGEVVLLHLPLPLPLLPSVCALPMQDRRMDVRSRIAGCLASGGTSITVTSLTDFIAFIIGYVSARLSLATHAWQPICSCRAACAP